MTILRTSCRHGTRGPARSGERPLAQGSATRTMTAGHTHLGAVPVDAGECDAVAGILIRRRSRAIFPAQVPNIGVCRCCAFGSCGDVDAGVVGAA